MSKYFSDSELSCHCCNRLYIVPNLLSSLELLREQTGKPIKVLRGYSCVKHNQLVSGETASQHIVGKAADIVIIGLSVKQMYEAALKIPDFSSGGIGIYPMNGFIHVDVRPKPARWARIKKMVKKVLVDEYVSITEGLKYVS